MTLLILLSVVAVFTVVGAISGCFLDLAEKEVLIPLWTFLGGMTGLIFGLIVVAVWGWMR